MKEERRYAIPTSDDPSTKKGKWCTNCQRYHPVDEFGVNRTRPDGLQVSCKKSRVGERQAYMKKNKEKWDDKHPQKEKT